MAKELSTAVQWPSTFTVDSASWTPNDFRGFKLIDCFKNQWIIQGNTADTLVLVRADAPPIGLAIVLSSPSPAWTVGQWANTAQLQSVLVDSAGTQHVIMQSTADTLVLGDVTSLPSGAFTILQGGAVAYRSSRFAGTITKVVGYWQIIQADGTAGTDSLTDDGAVTSTAGGATMPVTTLARRSLVVDGRAIESLSLNALFLTGSSPKGTLKLLINNTPGEVGSGALPGPSVADPFWVPVMIKMDDASSALFVTIDDTDPHVIITEQPIIHCRWYLLEWTPDNSPGTGVLKIFIYGFGVT